MNKKDKLKLLYEDYKTIVSAQDLQKRGLTLEEYDCIPYIISYINTTGKSTCLMSGIVNYFAKFGFKVESDGINYIIK